MKNWLTGKRGFIAFLLCFGFFRLAIADWNPVPSGSMRPTLLEGDPQRGDVITFSSPKDGVRLIKRLVALPGDTVELRNEHLFINGQASTYAHLEQTLEPVGNGQMTPAIRASEVGPEREHTVQFPPKFPAWRNFGPVTVPEGQYFFLGDNRDNSADPRFIGMVPRHLLIGRAHHIVVSVNMLGDWMPRFERVGERIR
jgi:signal peptidase I